MACFRVRIASWSCTVRWAHPSLPLLLRTSPRPRCRRSSNTPIPRWRLRLEKVLAAVIPKPRETVITEFQPAVLHQRGCDQGTTGLHRSVVSPAAVPAGRDLQAGPDLHHGEDQGARGLLSAILDPNKEVAPQFIAYTVETQDGQTLGGLLAEDDTFGSDGEDDGGAGDECGALPGEKDVCRWPRSCRRGWRPVWIRRAWRTCWSLSKP